MRTDDIEHREALAEPRTIDVLIAEDFGGNVTGFATQYGLSESDRSVLADLLQRIMSLDLHGTVIRRICAAVGAEQETLFPPDSFLRSLFETTEESPAFRVLAKKYNLVWQDPTPQALTLKRLFREKKLSEHDYRRFLNVCEGRIRFKPEKVLCERVAAALETPVNELFPPHMYGAQDHLPWPDDTSLSIEDFPDAQGYLVAARGEPISAEEDVRKIRERIALIAFDALFDEAARSAVIEHCGLGKSIQAIAKERGTSAYVISRLLQRSYELMRSYLPEEDLRILDAIDRRDDRVRI